MTDLRQQATEYAEQLYRKLANEDRVCWDLRKVVADAYEQGWVDRSFQAFNDKIAKRSDFAPDCTYYDCGDCKKGLPDTPCEFKGCVCYTPKNEKV